MAAQPCKECGRRPKAPGRHRCDTCQLRHEPIGDQVAASARRLAMVPPELRVKRTKKILAQAPKHTSFCAACQSFRDLVDFGKKATTCRACMSAKSHAASVAKTYGLTGSQYAELLKLQGGKCAICRARPVSKRLAVDHNHTTGEVRGLLCSRCNHDLLGSAWDSLALATALWHYMNTPPASGAWLPPEAQPRLGPVESAQRLSDASAGSLAVVTPGDGDRHRAPIVAAASPESAGPRYLPVGSESVPGKRGVWRYFAEPDADAPF